MRSKTLSGAPSAPATLVALAVFVGMVFLPGVVNAEEPTLVRPRPDTASTVPEAAKPLRAPTPGMEIRRTEPPVRPAGLAPTDAAAALEAMQFALSEVGDGATYVWHRWHGRLSGLVKPTRSFKDRGGALCRHVVVRLVSGAYSRGVEGIACREPDGVWSLSG